MLVSAGKILHVVDYLGNSYRMTHHEQHLLNELEAAAVRQEETWRRKRLNIFPEWIFLLPFLT